jgi:hypothetical protein
MKSNIGVTRKFIVVNVLLAFLGFGLFAVGCHEAAEGDRCNPDLVPMSSDCNSGLTCQMPSTCVENYCCPTPASSSTNGYCNGTLCPPPPDAGTD